ncbi:uncharacterized protein TNCV_904631 [Trichonephila clavipes]|nr:uncharacterized protein TNCV_904631 [Trichonephila clavipes]
MTVENSMGDEAHFHLSGTVNTHNCRIWDTENHAPSRRIPTSLTESYSLVWIHSHIHSWTFLFRRDYLQWPVTCTVTAREHDHLVSRDLNPCDFWLWGYLKNFVYRGRLMTLADLKDSITLHVRSISVDQLRSAVEQTLHRLQILHLEEGNHIKQHSLHR